MTNLMRTGRLERERERKKAAAKAQHQQQHDVATRTLQRVIRGHLVRTHERSKLLAEWDSQMDKLSQVGSLDINLATWAWLLLAKIQLSLLVLVWGENRLQL